MFRFHRDKIQRIPVLWIASTNRTIPVASVERREIYTGIDQRNFERLPEEESGQIFSLADAILLKEE